MTGILLNGEQIDDSQVKEYFYNRGFTYGDGFFETMRFENGQLLYGSEHLVRISSACKITDINFPPDIANKTVLEEKVRVLAKKCELPSAKVKLYIWRKAGGLFTPLLNESEYLIQVSPFKSSSIEKYNAIISKKVTNHFSAVSQFKTLSSQKYVIAGLELKNRGGDEIIILDGDGNVSECLTSNIFWVKDDQVFTPDIFTGCIDGIMKGQLINHLCKMEVPVFSGRYPYSLLKDADYVFTSNISGLSTIRKIEETHYSSDSFIQQYFKEF